MPRASNPQECLWTVRWKEKGAGERTKLLINSIRASRNREGNGALWRFRVGVFPKNQRGGIQAKAQSGWLWAIVENVPQMGITPDTKDLGAHHAMAAVNGGDDIFGSNRLVETGPPGARIKF